MSKHVKRARIWLEHNGKVNTLTGHLAAAGYRRQFATTLAKRFKCRPAELPLHVLEEYLGGPVRRVPQPENWADIVYGAGNHPFAKRPHRAGMRPGDVERTPEVRFLTMPAPHTASRTRPALYY